MDIDIAATPVGHDESKALLIIEKLDLAVDHRPARPGIAVASASEAIAASESVTAPEAIPASKSVTSTKAIATSETVTAPARPFRPPAESVAIAAAIIAEVPARPSRRGCFRRARIDAVDRNDLQSTRRILQVADKRRARCKVRRPMRLQGGCVAECVPAIVQGDEAISLGGVEPLDLGLN